MIYVLGSITRDNAFRSAEFSSSNSNDMLHPQIGPTLVSLIQATLTGCEDNAVLSSLGFALSICCSIGLLTPPPLPNHDVCLFGEERLTSLLLYE